jgi:hypothetical protein
MFEIGDIMELLIFFYCYDTTKVWVTGLFIVCITTLVVDQYELNLNFSNSH